MRRHREKSGCANPRQNQRERTAARRVDHSLQYRRGRLKTVKRVFQTASTVKVGCVAKRRTRFPMWKCTDCLPQMECAWRFGYVLRQMQHG
ncbi:hypothetical protein [Kingella potus]|uniref:hypothetical protein n=1 Tax=Kingella potus TaxID=265175 RepID=UPI001FD46D68|nr:hypothetical protein [Kingella potus]UOP01969.1 hypothetical protein LVJ84_01075 [Kingella potus]